MNLRIAGLAVIAVLWTQPAPLAQDMRLVIIVNKANPTDSLSLGELRRIFMKQTRVWNHGDQIVPVDWDATSEARQVFSGRVLGRSPREMTEFWVQQTYTQGLNPPSTLKSARAVLRFVASAEGAISYVPASEVDDTVKTVKVPGLQ